jgi:hypothetical protein
LSAFLLGGREPGGSLTGFLSGHSLALRLSFYLDAANENVF